MRTDALLTAIVATCFASQAHAQTDLSAAGASDQTTSHFTVGAGAEIDLVGLAYGVRPEFLYRPIADSGANLRIAVGLLAGPEITFLPASIGYRHVWSRNRRVRPHLGGGLEYQTFWYGGDHPTSRSALYVETGFEIRVGKMWLGIQGAPDLSVFSGFGFGLAGRITARYDL